MKRPTEQIYGNYSPEDFLVWKTLYNRQMAILEKSAANDYLNAIQQINFSADRIPDFMEVNKLLAARTNWGLTTVPNISPVKEFFEFLTKKKFTATCWLRTMAQMDYLEEPDMFHDVFGHAPLLTNQSYCDFFKELGEMAMQHLDNDEIITMVGRLYWFTIEFGLIQEGGQTKVFGAGIMSSNSESHHALSNDSKKISFNVKEVMHSDYRTDILQEKYFVIDSFPQLAASVGEIRKELEVYIK
ncbi:MAG: phenylalanine 4-monooxygenase [Bacteroidetes bacterium]|nr:phenylalanine 4-monooxygenase [Bacteroidota bacterium]